MLSVGLVFLTLDRCPLAWCFSPSITWSLSAGLVFLTKYGSLSLVGAAAELMSSVIAPPDACEPRPSTVRIPPDPDPRFVYYPTCTPVPRCGGCCNVDLLECTPTSMDTIVVEVSITAATSVG